MLLVRLSVPNGQTARLTQFATSDGDVFAVRTKGHSSHRAGMSCEYPKLLPRLGIPHSGSRVHAACDDAPTVGAKCNAHHLFAMSGKRVSDLTALAVPNEG